VEIQEQEPMFQATLVEVEKEFSDKHIGVLMKMLRRELNVMKDLKSVEVQKVRAKERSSMNWSKIQDSYARKFLLKFKVKSP